jgi:hypothetical protein
MAATAARGADFGGGRMTLTKSPGALAALGASEMDGLGRHVHSETSLHQNLAQAPIRAELIGADHCSALGITATGYAPVLALCRLLIEAGHDPATPLEAWRGDTLCLRVRAIGEAAQLEPSPRGIGFVRRPGVRGGSPVRQNGAGYTGLPAYKGGRRTLLRPTDPRSWVDGLPPSKPKSKTLQATRRQFRNTGAAR